MRSSRELMTSFYNATSAAYRVSVSYAGALTRSIAGDALDAYLNPEQMLEELHRRSWNNGANVGIGHLGPAWQNWLPKMVYVTHPNPEYFQKIAGYGESETDPDPAARKPFDVVEVLLRQKTINNLQGREAMQEKALIKAHLNPVEKHEEIYQCVSRELLQLFKAVENEMMKNPRVPDINSYPVQINLLVNRVLAQCVFGIRTKIQPWHMATAMSVSKFITNPWPSSNDLNAAYLSLLGLSEDLLQNSVASIDPDKYIYAHAGLQNCATDAEKLEKLKKENIAASLLAGTNLSDLIMKTLVELSQNEEVRERLIKEIDQAGKNVEALKNLPYLDQVYREAMRKFSPSYIVRRTSKLFSLVTADSDGVEHTTHVPAGSYLFAPIRPRHMDPRLWPQPERFDPSRFDGPEGQAKIRLLMTFSDGVRSCPAKFGFTEVVFKTAIAEFFRHYRKLQLDSAVESTPIYSINTSWDEIYYISKLQPRPR